MRSFDGRENVAGDQPLAIVETALKETAVHLGIGGMGMMLFVFR